MSEINLEKQKSRKIVSIINNCGEEFVSLTELAEISGFSKKTLRNFINRLDNPLPCYRISKKIILVSKIEFFNWLRSHKEDSSWMSKLDLNNIIQDFNKNI
jgi:hypothetical protein